MVGRRLALVAALGMFAVAAGGASSCGTTTNDTADSGSGETSSQHHAKIGDSITLTGQDDAKIKVTVEKIADPISGGEFDSPSAGKHYVGVMLRLKNVGKKTYADAPFNGSTLITGRDVQLEPTILTGGDCSSSFSADLKLAPGDTRRGCIPFEAPKGPLRKFQFTLNSGFGGEVGEWVLRPGHTAK